MTHGEMQELYELYVLGALEVEQAVQIDAHVADGCEFCLDQIRQAAQVTAALPAMIEPVEPPAAVRERILASIATPKRAPRLQTPLMGLFAVAAAIALVFAFWATGQLHETRRRLEDALGQRDQLRSAIEILSRSQTRAVQFGANDNVAHGRVFVNQNGGFVFVGSDLPQITPDKTFELWLLPAKGAPQPAGLFRANPSGDFVHVANTAVDVKQIAAIAVSVEPKGGSSAPTTKPIVVVPLG